MRTSITFNNHNNITGYLLRKESVYLQVLEGEATVVRKLADKISRDPRLFHFEKLCEIQTRTRSYPGWSMGYHETVDASEIGSPLENLLQSMNTPTLVEPAMAEMQAFATPRILRDSAI